MFPGLLAASGGAADPVPVDAVQPAVAAKPSARDVQWRADLAELDPAKGMMLLTGDVTVRLDGLELSARRMAARYDAQADLRTLSGEGAVSVRVGETAATAARFELEPDQHRLVLVGPVRISVAGGWTNAERAEVDTRSGRLTLHRVQGSLPLSPRQAAPRAP